MRTCTNVGFGRKQTSPEFSSFADFEESGAAERVRTLLELPRLVHEHQGGEGRGLPARAEFKLQLWCEDRSS